MDSKLDQAREYAQWMIDTTPRHHQSKARAAAEVIQSLPDQWIDAEKVREILAEQYMKIEGNDTKWINAATIESLIPPRPPRPEDVTAGEPWLVKHDGHEWVGTRESRVETVCSWTLARLDGADYTVARDDEITLVSRLVPECKENA